MVFFNPTAEVGLTCHGTRTTAAVRLGINRSTLHRKMEDYNLQYDSR